MISSSAWLQLGAVCLAVRDGPADIPPSRAQTSLLGVRTQCKCCSTGSWWGAPAGAAPPEEEACVTF